MINVINIMNYYNLSNLDFESFIFKDIYMDLYYQKTKAFNNYIIKCCENYIKKNKKNQIQTRFSKLLIDRNEICIFFGSYCKY